MERVSFWPTETAAQKHADFIEARDPGGVYSIKRQQGGLWRLAVQEAPTPGPTLLYNLELDAEELSALHQLLQDLSTACDTFLMPPEKSIQDKVIRLMEGR